MLIRFSLLFVLTATLFTTCATPYASTSSPKFSGRYASDYQPGETEISTSYQYALSQLGGVFVQRTYFPSTRTLIGYAEFSDKDFKTYNGKYSSFYDNGPLREAGNYTNDDRTGEWSYYHKNGQLSSTGNYVAGKYSGVWKNYDEEGKLRSTKTYAGGELDGTLVRYDEDGTVTETAEYKGGEMVSTTAPTGPENNDLLKTVEQMPLFPGCEAITDYTDRKSCADRTMLEFIYSRIRYPAHAREYGVEGMAVVSFVIEKDGRVTDIDVLRGLDTDIAAEVRRITTLMPTWEPGMQDGKPVRVQFNLPVKFQLE